MQQKEGADAGNKAAQAGIWWANLLLGDGHRNTARELSLLGSGKEKSETGRLKAARQSKLNAISLVQVTKKDMIERRGLQGSSIQELC